MENQIDKPYTDPFDLFYLFTVQTCTDRKTNESLTSVAPPSGLHGNRIGEWSVVRHPTGAPLGSCQPAPPSPARPCPPAQLQHVHRPTASDLKEKKQ